ncbi:MAG: hypothetical protein A4E49_00203 [Methanosaeta sp. PtaU1.Bin112]|nr:MAG: hypothetical protein A4E49_00203 [Methanosaeta sp. PtaU1.Bin112]
MTKDGLTAAEILQEIEALCSLHDKISRSSECRDFNRRAAFLLQILEDTDCENLADRVMSLLAYCNPKDLSHVTASSLPVMPCTG